MREIKADILIVGGGIGGCAATLSACSSGRRVVMTEESDWIGGQFTSQATPPDEHGWIERFGCTRTYRLFRNSSRQYYRDHYPLTTQAAADPFLNPGNGWVSPLCCEPKVFLSVLESMLSEFTSSGLLTILTEHILISAETNRDRVASVTVQSLLDGEMSAITAEYFIDATENGELLPLAGVEYITGSESQLDTGEPSAKIVANPTNSQAFSMCFAMSYHEGEDHTIDRPSNYLYFRNFVPDLDPPWSGPLLRLTGLSPRTLEPVTYNFQPDQEANIAFAGLWTYRRILHRHNFKSGAFDSDITLVNYPQIDYLGGDLNSCDRNERTKLKEGAKEQSLSFLYYLQTELGWKGLKLRGDVTETDDGLAKMPYIRESRRIKAEFTVAEEHVSAELRPSDKFAESFADSVGIGYYRIDLHPTVGGDNYVDVAALPFQIPLGALIPERCENLLPACKNIGTTHITNGCYRLHPVEWNIGEAVGHLAAYCFENQVSPRSVRNSKVLFEEYRSRLVKAGVETEWPADLNLEDGDPHIHAR